MIALEGGADILVELADALAGKGANLTALSLLPGDPPRLGFTVDDEDAARRALDARGVRAQAYPVVERSLENTPGSFALAAHALADAGSPIQLLLTLRASRGQTTDVIAVGNVEAARLVLQGLAGDVLLD